MFKELIDLWKNRGIMINAVNKFGEMLELTSLLFEESFSVFTRGLPEDPTALKTAISEKDISVNKLEREIRRLLMEHLTINPGQDASGCLALMSLVKDAERIGDYCKNIYELKILHNTHTCELSYLPQFIELQTKIANTLRILKDTFINSDEKKAQEIIDQYTAVKPQLNDIVEELFDKDISKNEALVTVLLTRYLKRINSHASNVASGIVYPLDKIDFVRKSR